MISVQDIERLTSPEREFHSSIQFTFWVQFQLHVQLLDASKYAARHRVALKGDLPIGVAFASPPSPLPLPIPANMYTDEILAS